MALKDLREKRAQLVADARAKLAEITDKTSEADAQRLEREHDAIMAEYDRVDGQVAREEKLAEAEARANPRDPRRPNGGDIEVDPVDPKDLKVRQKEAIDAYLRYGREGMTGEQRQLLKTAVLSPDEARAQGVVDSTAGGYLVPQGFMDELIVTMKAYGPMNDTNTIREVATTSGNPIPWPSMDDTANKGRRLAENTTVNTATLAFGAKLLNAYKYTTDVVLVSSELLQDSAIDPEEIVRDAMGIRMGRILNTDLTLGTGASQPVGIVFGATSTYTAASSTAITFDDVIETEHSLDPAYRKLPGVRWQFADSTLKALRKLKNGDGDYIWQPASVVAAAPATILGYGYEINQDMAAIATGVTSMIFGDHKRYIRRRVKDFTVRRLNERYADNDQVGFIGFGRFDGNLIDTNAIRALVHP